MRRLPVLRGRTRGGLARRRAHRSGLTTSDLRASSSKATSAADPERAKAPVALPSSYRPFMSDPTPSKRLHGDSMFLDPLVAELLDARLIAVFATLDRTGTIHAVPMWFAPDEQSILLATGSRSRKVENLEVDSRSTLVIHDSRPGFEVCGASIVGQTEVVYGAEAGPLIGRVHHRYVDEEGGVPEAARAFLESDDVALRFRPRSALTWDERGAEATTALRVAGRALPLLTTEPRS